MDGETFQLASGLSVRFLDESIEFLQPSGESAAAFSVADVVGLQRSGQIITFQHRTSGAIEVTLATVADANGFEETLRSAMERGMILPAIVESTSVPPETGFVRSQLMTNDEIVRAEVGKILMPVEQIIAVAHQDNRAPTVKKASAVATSHRLILFRPTMVGSFNFWDARWHDISDVHLKQGMMFSDLVIRKVNGEGITLDKLNKEQARHIYGICQQQEYEWKERRRQRQMEEDRAKAGGVTINQGIIPGMPPASMPPQIPPVATSPVEDPVAKLQRAKQMLDAGLITETEYAEVKQRILAAM